MSMTISGRLARLRELQIALAAIGAVGTAGALAGLARAVLGGTISVSVPADAIAAQARTGTLHSNATLDPSADAGVTLHHPDTLQILLSILTWLPACALFLTVLALLWRQVARARRLDPFASGTARHLRALGWILTIAGPITWAVQIVARMVLSGTVLTSASGVAINLAAPMAWALTGLGLLTIAEIVHRGEELHRELEAVI